RPLPTQRIRGRGRLPRSGDAVRAGRRERLVSLRPRPGGREALRAGGRRVRPYPRTRRESRESVARQSDGIALAQAIRRGCDGLRESGCPRPDDGAGAPETGGVPHGVAPIRGGDPGVPDGPCQEPEGDHGTRRTEYRDGGPRPGEPRGPDGPSDLEREGRAPGPARPDGSGADRVRSISVPESRGPRRPRGERANPVRPGPRS